MHIGLLESLRKYTPKIGHDPLENFITDAFAWILNNNPEFSEFFINKILENPSMKLSEIEPKNCQWITQSNFDGVFPDMVCISNNSAIIFEHKAWIELSENQLQNYKNYANQNFEQNKIVLITATKNQHSQNPDLALCWSDIYKLIETWLDKNIDISFIFEDFLKLLKSEGMNPPAPISHVSIKYYYATSELKQNISNLIKRVEHEDWSLHIKKDYELFVENKKGSVYGEGWGKIGINLLNSWTPKIFVGIVLDGNDYVTGPINPSKGPDFCLILAFDPKLYDQYRLNANYLEMVNILSTKVKNLGNGWQLYNHLEDNKIKNKNKHYPLHIRKSMLDVFVGTLTMEEQAQIFYETANNLIQIVTEEECFWKLRDDYK